MGKKEYKPVPFATKERCRKLVMQGKTYADIEKATGVDELTLAKWVKQGGWRKLKRQLAQERWEDAEIKYRDFQAENKEAEARRQHDVASMIEEKVREEVEQIVPGDKGADVKLARAARTLNDAAAVGARAVGMAERKEEVSALDGENKAQGRIPILMIGIQTRAAGDAKPIDGDVVEVETVDDEERGNTDGSGGDSWPEEGD